MLWNEAAMRILNMPDRTVGGTDLLRDDLLIAGRLPEAVREWYGAGADRRLDELSDNEIASLASHKQQPGAGLLEANFLLLETDSQHCCRWVVALNEGDNPPVYLVDPDDFSGSSRSRYAENFTSYTEAAARDALLFSDQSAAWSFDHDLQPNAVPKLATLLRQGPTTFGWAHNQGCDAVYRFDGRAMVSMAVAGAKAVWTVTSAPDPVIRTRILDILTVPIKDR